MSPWHDFSGAPPILIPASLIGLWRGTTDPTTEHFSDLNRNEPKTDYDRACAIAWPGKGELDIGQSTVLVIYTEYDEHAWIAKENVVASGGWFPTSEQLTLAKWTDSFYWRADHEDYLLLNAAVDGRGRLVSADSAAVRLIRGTYIVEYAFIEAEYLGCFTRLTQKVNVE